jgi:hypothetical protein
VPVESAFKRFERHHAVVAAVAHAINHEQGAFAYTL